MKNSWPTLRNIIFMDNNATLGGGGMHVQGAGGAFLFNVSFMRCSSLNGRGGAVNVIGDADPSRPTFVWHGGDVVECSARKERHRCRASAWETFHG